MDRHLRPVVLTTDPSSPDALKTWRHRRRTFDFFLQSLPTTPAPNKLATLVNFVGPSVYELIAEASTYENAITILETTYDKPKNEVFARHLLSSCKQEQGQSLDQFLQKLKNLAKDCNFKACTAEVKNEAIRDAFIGGLISPQIRQRLLENSSLDLDTAFENARTLDMAEKQSLSYRSESVTAAIDQLLMPSLLTFSLKASHLTTPRQLLLAILQTKSASSVGTLNILATNALQRMPLVKSVKKRDILLRSVDLRIKRQLVLFPVRTLTTSWRQLTPPPPPII